MQEYFKSKEKTFQIINLPNFPAQESHQHLTSEKENYSLTLDQVTFEKLKAFGEKLGTIKTSTPTKIFNFVNANANLDYDVKNLKINLLRPSKLKNNQKQFQYSPKNQNAIQCYYCQQTGHKKSECRKRKAEQLNNSSNYGHNSYLNRDINRATNSNYQNRSIHLDQKNDDTTDTGETGNDHRNFNLLPNTSAIASTSRVIINNDKYRRNNSPFSNSSDIINVNHSDNTKVAMNNEDSMDNNEEHINMSCFMITKPFYR